MCSIPPLCATAGKLCESKCLKGNHNNKVPTPVNVVFQRCPCRALLEPLHAWFSGSYGVTDDEDDDKHGGYSGAARSHQSIMLVEALAAMVTAIITALYNIFEKD